MFTKYLSRLSAMAVAAAVVFSLSGCNKSTASIPETSPDVTVDALSEIETVETSGENLVSSESATEESATKKSTAKETKTETTTEKTTKKEESSSKADVVETTTQAATTKAAGATTETTTQKQTETTTAAQKQTEKATEAHKHSYTSSVTKASTCTSEGVMTFKCSCGDSYTETIGKTAHSFGGYTYNNDATYESDGTETAVCSVCGERTTRTAGGTKLVHVHSYADSVTTAPTCTTDGVKTFACSCGSSYTEAIPATGHQFGDYSYNNDATTSADGTKTRYCSVCSETETVTAEGTKKSLPSWYDEHSETLNTPTGSQHNGTLEMYFTDGDWTAVSEGCNFFGYSNPFAYVGTYAEGNVYHGWLE